MCLPALVSSHCYWPINNPPGLGPPPNPTLQHASSAVPSLLWQVRSSIGPLLRVRGVDGLVGGQGRVDWRLWGWLPLQRATGGEDLNKTMLVRWLSGE